MNGPIRDLYRDRKWWVTLLAVSILTLTTVMYMVEGGVEKGAYIEVEEVFFLMTDQDNDTTTMNIDVFITNHGDEDLSDVTVRAFAVEEDSNLARDEASVELGALGGQMTIEGNLTITLPNDESYRVELLVFKEGKLAIRGSGNVNLRTSVEYINWLGNVDYYYDARTTNYTTTKSDIPPAKSEADDGTLGASDEDVSSYLCIVGGGSILVLVIVIAKGVIGHVESRPPRERIPPPHITREWEREMYWQPGPPRGPMPPSRPQERTFHYRQDTGKESEDGPSEDTPE